MNKLTAREILRDEIIELKKQVKEKMKLWRRMDLEDCEVNGATKSHKQQNKD